MNPGAERRLGSVQDKLRNLFEEKKENYFLYNPFAPDHLFTRRIFQGYFGPIASHDRSVGIENRSDHLIAKINAERGKWKNKLRNDQTSEIKNKEIITLESKWPKLSKSKSGEEKWLIEALGFTTAYFEQRLKQKGEDIEIWDNQLLYISLMTLGKGDFSIGNLLTDNRAVQLDTGEGKTKCTGIIAALKIFQGKEVIVVEQNYISAEKHAQELAPFFEDFLHVNTGVVVDRSQGKGMVKDTRVKNDGTIERTKMMADSLRKSFIYTDGEMRDDLPGTSGRRQSWKQSIVYCDHNSIGTDVVSDRQITTADEDRFVPDLSKRVGLVQEADGLAIDEAANPFLIQQPAVGKQAWQIINNLFFSDTETNLFKRGKLHIQEQVHSNPIQRREKIEFTKKYFYFLWGNLYKIVKNDNSLVQTWKDKRAYITTSSHELKYDDSIVDSIVNNLIKPMSPLFDDDLHLTRNFLRQNNFLIETALEILMTGGQGEGFLSGEKPILMDNYGVPLDNRQRDTIYQIFLQLYNVWIKEELINFDYSTEDVIKIREKTWFKMEIPFKIYGKIIPALLYREFGELKLTSGSLIPASDTLKELYGAETIAVSRHKPISKETTDKKGFYTNCLDGGTAHIHFVKEKIMDSLIFDLINTIQSEGKAGLIIMPDDKSAYELNRLLRNHFEGEALSSLTSDELITIDATLEDKLNIDRQIKVITAKQEFEKRGMLQEAISQFDPGDILITTQMASRDVDPNLSPHVKDNGGLTTIVYNPPNERGLWQALQRSTRADIPGERILLVTEDSLKDVKNQYLVNPPLKLPGDIFVSQKVLNREHQQKTDRLFTQALNGNLEAQKTLFGQYVGHLRIKEGQVADSVMFAMVKDLPLEKLKGQLFHIMGDENTNLFENYLDLISSADYKKSVISKKDVQAFLNIGSKKERDQLLDNLNLFSDMGYMETKNSMRKRAMITLWSDLLEFMNEAYTDFHIGLANRGFQPHSYLQYQGGWEKKVEDLIANNIDFRSYFLQKLEDLEI